jgi:hypothetical protein
MRTKSFYKMRMLMLVFLAAASYEANCQTVTQIFAISQFLDPQGNTGIVSVSRSTDSGVTITRMAYSFCLETTASQCAEGTGEVPASDVTSNLSTNLAQPAKLTLLADTSTIAGYSNSLCINPDNEFGCGSTVPASGGMVSLTFSKTADSAGISSNLSRAYKNRVLVSIVTDQSADYSETMLGTVLGTPVQPTPTQGQLSFEQLTFTYVNPAMASVAKGLESSSKYQPIVETLGSQQQGQKIIAWLKRVGMLTE